MVDFTPLAAIAAGRAAMAQFKAGRVEFDERGSADVPVGDHVVRMAVAPGCSGPVVRVIDPAGRHWFPELEGTA